ncbi:aminoglycoside phosphotransferase [Streptomyces sp. NPDC097619]|uniref:phosphotransferase family protein n=1 Tax=Streptomyces sp. NPDC097619 TaxID=3157228 RepID=UPI00332BA855
MVNPNRIPYAELPTAVRAAVDERVGGPAIGEDTELGDSSAVAALLTGGDGERVFLKGLPDGHERMFQLDTETLIAPHLPGFAPPLLWRTSVGGWTLLAFEGLYATPWAHFLSDSPHLEPCAAVVRELSEVSVPDGVGLPTVWERWAEYCEPADEALLTGRHLVHGDPAYANFLIDAEDRAHLVDWAWAARGPAWVTAALWGLRLVLDGGHTPAQAAAWAATVPAFARAPREAIAVLTRAEARSFEDWQEYGGSLADQVAGSRAWAAHWSGP